MRSTLFCLFLFGSVLTNAQNETKTVDSRSFSFLELYHYLQTNAQSSSSNINFVNCQFTSSATGNEESIFQYYDDADQSDFPVTKLRIPFEIRFDNCTFNNEQNHQFNFINLYFLGEVYFNNCRGYGIHFQDCISYRKLSFIDPDLNYLKFKNHRFYEAFNFNDSKIEQLRFSNCTFIANEESETFGLQFENQNSFTTFVISQTEFVDASANSAFDKKQNSVIHDLGMLRFMNFSAERFLATENYFDCAVVFEEFSVQSVFKFENQLLRQMVFNSVPTLPTESSSFPYSSIEGRIGITLPLSSVENRFIQYNDKQDFVADLQKPWADKDPERRIIPVLSRLLAIYNAKNDLESYNKCFKSFKVIEQTASEVRSDTFGGFQNKFRFWMDWFLGEFSAYGTDPVLSLQNGFYTILLFAILYVLFPSEPDNLSLTRIKEAFKRYISHFGKGNKEFYTPSEIFILEIQEIANLKNEIAAYKSQLPPVIRFFSMPIYYMVKLAAHTKHKIRQLFYYNVYDDWQQLTSQKKFKTTSILTISLVLFAFWGLFMRTLNALALSLNAFVTLGYGEIEAKGVARYFCVLEGIVGWFLLSIFSVSLISQILQ